MLALNFWEDGIFGIVMLFFGIGIVIEGFFILPKKKCNTEEEKTKNKRHIRITKLIGISLTIAGIATLLGIY